MITSTLEKLKDYNNNCMKHEWLIHQV